MAIKISWAKMNDLKDLIALNKLAHKENKSWEVGLKSEYRKVIRKSKFLTLMAWYNGRPVAYLQSGLRNTKKHLWIEDILVLKEFRNKGVGKMLINKFVNHWRNKADFIVLITEDKNMKIFNKLGFEKEMNYTGYKHSKGKRESSNSAL
jgi:ribosomal protein S18 acetylase RimI-like enzyme